MAFEITPLLIPAGAFQGLATLSLNAYTPGIIVEAGTHTCCPVFGSIVWSQGQYVAEYELFKALTLETVLPIVAPYPTVSKITIEFPLFWQFEIKRFNALVWEAKLNTNPGTVIKLNL